MYSWYVHEKYLDDTKLGEIITEFLFRDLCSETTHENLARFVSFVTFWKELLLVFVLYYYYY